MSLHRKFETLVRGLDKTQHELDQAGCGELLGHRPPSIPCGDRSGAGRRRGGRTASALVHALNASGTNGRAMDWAGLSMSLALPLVTPLLDPRRVSPRSGTAGAHLGTPCVPTRRQPIK